MSSKYSQFRKTKQTAIEKSPNKLKQLKDSFQLVCLEQMMHQLQTKRSQNPAPMTRRTSGRWQNVNELKKVCSQKNSQTNQTSDATTTLDQQLGLNMLIEKLPIHPKSTTRRHNTQHQILSYRSDKAQQSDILNKYGHSAEDSLLSEVGITQSVYMVKQQDISLGSAYRQTSEEQKKNLLNKINEIEKIVQIKKINNTQYNMLMNKLSLLEDLLQQF